MKITEVSSLISGRVYIGVRCLPRQHAVRNQLLWYPYTALSETNINKFYADLTLAVAALKPTKQTLYYTDCSYTMMDAGICMKIKYSECYTETHSFKLVIITFGRMTWRNAFRKEMKYYRLACSIGNFCERGFCSVAWQRRWWHYRMLPTRRMRTMDDPSRSLLWRKAYDQTRLEVEDSQWRGYTRTTHSTHSLIAARNRLWVVAPSMLTGRRRVPMRLQQWVRCPARSD